MSTLVVMQPTFLPWMGYFALIHLADDFVILDDVQFSKQSWQSRNQVNGPNGPVLLSLPVARKPSFPLISEAQIADRDLRKEIVARVQGCLGKAPYWDLVESLLTEGLAHAPEGLQAVNVGLIRRLAETLGLSTRFHMASALGVPGGEKAERLLAMSEALGADEYLSPVGSAGYLSEGHPFTNEGVRLRFLNFTHPEYAQRWKPFRSHMSVIDAMAWVGPEATKALILGGIGEGRRLEELA